MSEKRLVNLDEALIISDYKTPRSLQRAAAAGKLYVEKIPNPAKNNVKEAFYSVEDLEKLKAEKSQSQIIGTLDREDATTHDQQNEMLTPIVAQSLFEPLRDVLFAIKDGLDEIRANQKQLPPAPEPEPTENPTPTKQNFLTIDAAAAEFHLSKSYLRELVKAGTLTKHKGERGKTLISRREIENL